MTESELFTVIERRKKMAAFLAEEAQIANDPPFNLVPMMPGMLMEIAQLLDPHAGYELVYKKVRRTKVKPKR